MGTVTFEVEFELFGFLCDEIGFHSYCGFAIALEMGIVLANFFNDPMTDAQWYSTRKKLQYKVNVFNCKCWMNSLAHSLSRSLACPFTTSLWSHITSSENAQRALAVKHQRIFEIFIGFIHEESSLVFFCLLFSRTDKRMKNSLELTPTLFIVSAKSLIFSVFPQTL